MSVVCLETVQIEQSFAGKFREKALTTEANVGRPCLSISLCIIAA